MTTTDTEHDLTEHDLTGHPDVPDDQHGAEHADTDPAEHAADPDAVDEDASGRVGELVSVDPHELVIGANVRQDGPLDRRFLRSVRDRGVREPIIARRRDDNVLVVRKGKRRTLAAVQAGLARVPVLVEPDPAPAEDDKNGQIDRIVDQLEENAHRTPNTDVEEVTAHQELLDLGLSAGQIARRTHSPTKRVRVTTQVARSDIATAALTRYDLTLDQLSVIAEFDDTHPDHQLSPAAAEAVTLLIVTARQQPGQFAHVAQRLRDDRDDAARIAARVAELTAAGIAVIEPDGVNGAAQISGLRPTADDASGTELTADAHAGCPGHAAHVEVRRRSWEREAPVRTVYWCTDPAGNGHTARWDSNATTGTGTGGRVPGPLSDAEKAARRLVIANNKDWDSAATVRREWLHGFLARRTPPRNAAVFIAATLGGGGHYLRKAMESGHPTACELLGMTPAGSVYHATATGRRSPIAAAAGTAGAPRAVMLSLAVLLGAAEDATSRDTWRHPTSDDRAYFTALSGWGYPLSDVEQLVLTPSDPAAGETAVGPEAAGDPEAADDGVVTAAAPDVDATAGEEARSDAA